MDERGPAVRTAVPVTKRPPPWRDVRILRALAQAVFVGAVVWVLYVLWTNLVVNMRRQGLDTSFVFVDRPAGFRITGSAFRSSGSIREALWIGLRNTILVSAAGVVLATLLGFLVGLARLSTNWLVRRAAGVYVESLRNVPVLVIILFWSTAVVLRLPSLGRAREWLGMTVVSNSGVWVPAPQSGPAASTYVGILAAGVVAAVLAVVWQRRRADATGRPSHGFLWAAGMLILAVVGGYFALGSPVGVSVPERTGRLVVGGSRLVPEFAALLAGLVVYTAAHIAEIVRGSVLAVAKGQSEAARALGLSEGDRLRYVVVPQALRIAVPPLANQYLNLTKNSSLAVAIGYAEISTVTFIAIGNANPAPQLVALLMAAYLALSLVIAAFTNLANRRLARWSR